MSAELALGVPIAAHFAGLALKRRKRKWQQRANWIIVAGVTILILALSIFAGMLRANHLAPIMDAGDPAATRETPPPSA